LNDKGNCVEISLKDDYLREIESLKNEVTTLKKKIDLYDEKFRNVFSMIEDMSILHRNELSKLLKK